MTDKPTAQSFTVQLHFIARHHSRIVIFYLIFMQHVEYIQTLRRSPTASKSLDSEVYLVITLLRNVFICLNVIPC